MCSLAPPSPVTSMPAPAAPPARERCRSPCLPCIAAWRAGAARGSSTSWQRSPAWWLCPMASAMMRQRRWAGVASKAAAGLRAGRLQPDRAGVLHSAFLLARHWEADAAGLLGLPAPARRIGLVCAHHPCSPVDAFPAWPPPLAHMPGPASTCPAVLGQPGDGGGHAGCAGGTAGGVPAADGRRQRAGPAGHPGAPGLGTLPGKTVKSAAGSVLHCR